MTRRLLVAAAVLLIVGSVAAQTTTDEGVAMFKARRWAEAQGVFEKALASNPKDAVAHAYLGLIFNNLHRDYDRAVEHLEQAVALADGNSDFHVWLGACYIGKAQSVGMFKAGSLARKSKAEWERAVELKPDNLDARFSLMQWYLNAPGLFGGSVAKAKEQAAAVEKLAPTRGALAFAAIHEYEKNPAKAEECYRRVIAAEPNQADGYNNLGYFLLRQKRPDEGIVAFKRAVELKPDDANAHDSLADGYVAKGSTDEALAEYLKAVSIDPRFSSSHAGAGECYEKKGLRKEAKASYERFLELVPKGRRSDEIRKKLTSL
jgi:tetratricopeptide (TPR) repeat protein